VATRSSMTTPAPNTLLRPALEAAMQVARAGEAADPREPAPPALRRYLYFARLPSPALDIARRVIDEDEEFRQRVAEQLSEQEVGEAGWLWLTRPDGWKGRLEELRKKQQEAEHAVHDAKVERESQRRLAGAEDRARRAEVALGARAREAEEAKSALVEERALRRRLESDLAKVRPTMDELQSQRNAAVRRLKEVESELAQRTADLRHARHEIRMRETELEQAMVDRDAALQAVASSHTTEPTAELAAPPELINVVMGAAVQAERLSASLAVAADLLAVQQPTAPPEEPPTPNEPSQRERRTPVKLRPGTMDDSAEAAEQLLRTPGAVLLVDGYNISHAVWWDLPIAAQRDRLVGALAELHARTGVEIDVVFDGAEVERSAPTSARPAVRVRFSPPDIEADDIIIELVGSLPVNRAVIVASSDRRVREGARRQGANLLGARQLTEALRR
jgi:predicted RNA-binding protein with PIN domain